MEGLGIFFVDRPWFKLYSADTLMDSKLDAIPPEAEGLVLRIWCICHIEGRCPAEPKELARKTRRSLDYVLQYKSQCESLFALQDGFYISPRMERERKRSEINRANAKDRWKHKTSMVCNANGNAKLERIELPHSDNDYDSVDVDLELKVREIAKLYPRIADPQNLATIHATVIAEAIVRHGDKVLVGTKRFRECYDLWPKDQHGFASGVEKFFNTSEYLLDPMNRPNGKKESLLERNNRAYAEMERRSQ